MASGNKKARQRAHFGGGRRSFQRTLTDFELGQMSCGKRRFNAEQDARDSSPRLRPYLCPRCGGWHLSSKPDRHGGSA